MSPKDRRRNLRNIATMLLVVIIIIAAYILISNSPSDSVVVLSPDTVMKNTEAYLGKIVTLDGFYYNEGTEGEGVITSKIIGPGDSPTGFDQQLAVDHSNVNISLANEIKYRFTGELKSDESVLYGNAVILVADEIVQV